MRLLVVYCVPAAAAVALAQMAPQSANRGLVIAGVVAAAVWMLVASRLVK